MYVDLVGSTNMSMKLPVDKLVTIIREFSYELTSVIEPWWVCIKIRWGWGYCIFPFNHKHDHSLYEFSLMCSVYIECD